MLVLICANHLRASPSPSFARGPESMPISSGNHTAPERQLFCGRSPLLRVPELIKAPYERPLKRALSGQPTKCERVRLKPWHANIGSANQEFNMQSL